MRYAAAIVAIGMCLVASSAVQAVLTNDGMITLTGVPGNLNNSGGGGIAFIPANTDSISQDTLVINWKQNDNTHVFQRITIPAGGGASTVLATVTLASSVAYTGGTVGSSNMQDLAFDAVNNRLVTTMTGGRFLSIPLFAASGAITSDLGFSKADTFSPGDGYFGRVVTITPEGKYQTIYNKSSGLHKVSIAPDQMNGTVAPTRETIAISSFTGWYPNPSQFTSTLYDCQGAVAYGDDKVLVMRNHKNGTTAETHIYMADSVLDAAAINSATNLGNATILNSAASTFYGWGMTANPAAGVAFIRYGFNNAASSNPRILMVGGLPAVPDPATLALMLGGCALMAVRRRRA